MPSVEAGISIRDGNPTHGLGKEAFIGTPSKEIPLDELDSAIKRSVVAIARNRHPITGIFPAATRERHYNNGHYDHAWLRDGAIIILALNDPSMQTIYPPDSKLKRLINRISTKWLKGMFELIAKPEWQKGFSQEIKRYIDPQNAENNYTYLANLHEAPPIHFKTDGSICEWPDPNQPDAWGLFFSAVASAVPSTSYEMSDKEKEVMDTSVAYLVRTEPEHFEGSPMWEGLPTRNPPSLSTVALCGKGLEDIAPFVSERLRKLLARRINNARDFIEKHYPVDYTTPSNHYSQSDLATLVGLAHGALDGLPISKYFIQSELELGNGHIGKIRFVGDNYFSIDGESPSWFLGDAEEVIVLLDRTSKLKQGDLFTSAEKLKQKGLAMLGRALGVYNQYGFYPELFVRKNGEFKPPEEANDLLWNHAEMIRACALGILVQSDTISKSPVRASVGQCGAQLPQ